MSWLNTTWGFADLGEPEEPADPQQENQNPEVDEEASQHEENGVYEIDELVPPYHGRDLPAADSDGEEPRRRNNEVWEPRSADEYVEELLQARRQEQDPILMRQDVLVPARHWWYDRMIHEDPSQDEPYRLPITFRRYPYDANHPNRIYYTLETFHTEEDIERYNSERHAAPIEWNWPEDHVAQAAENREQQARDEGRVYWQPRTVGQYLDEIRQGFETGAHRGREVLVPQHLLPQDGTFLTMDPRDERHLHNFPVTFLRFTAADRMQLLQFDDWTDVLEYYNQLHHDNVVRFAPSTATDGGYTHILEVDPGRPDRVGIDEQYHTFPLRQDYTRWNNMQGTLGVGTDLHEHREQEGGDPLGFLDNREEEDRLSESSEEAIQRPRRRQEAPLGIIDLDDVAIRRQDPPAVETAGDWQAWEDIRQAAERPRPSRADLERMMRDWPQAERDEWWARRRARGLSAPPSPPRVPSTQSPPRPSPPTAPQQELPQSSSPLSSPPRSSSSPRVVIPVRRATQTRQRRRPGRPARQPQQQPQPQQQQQSSSSLSSPPSSTPRRQRRRRSWGSRSFQYQGRQTQRTGPLTRAMRQRLREQCQEESSLLLDGLSRRSSPSPTRMGFWRVGKGYRDQRERASMVKRIVLRRGEMCLVSAICRE